MAGTFTYDPTLLATSSLPRIRLTLGDTNPDGYLFSDEEIAYFVTKRSTEYGACAEAARSMAARFSSKVDASIDGMRANFSQKQEQWSKRAIEFDTLSAMSGGVIPYMGGISKQDMRAQEQNPDRVPPQYSIGMDDSSLPVPPLQPGEQQETFEP